MAQLDHVKYLTGDIVVQKYGFMKYAQKTESLTLSGASGTTTGMFPAGCIPLGVTCTVTTAITSGDGATSWGAGDGTNDDKWCTGQAFTDGTQTDMSDCDETAVTPSAAGEEVVIKPNSNTFSGGVVKIVGHYLTFVAPKDM